ncbi:MAG TPA: hypothetical protein PLK52_14580, partial [Usitatibacteraceae bacterium]|nr:hypothetical protein [Usitatibacteraceae bacterium]
MEIKKIAFGDEGQAATAALLARLPALQARASAVDPGLAPRLDRLKRGLETLQALDRQHGGTGPIGLEGVGELVSAIVTDLAHAEAAAGRAADAALTTDVADFLLGVSLWAVRHGVLLDPAEPIVNALAHRANAARSKQELAAVFGLMQGVIAHLAPRLAADLERSNPERPWRILHANLAITA